MTNPKNIEVLTTIPFPEPVMQRLKTLTPRIKVTFNPAQQVDDIPADLWNKIEVLYTDVLLPDPELVPNLKWIQFHYAGIDFIQGSPLLKKSNLVFTSMSGASAIQEGEYIIMMMLGLSHRLPELTINQMKKEWPKDRWEKFTPVELSGSTVGLVGYGSISREVARLLQPFNVKVLAAKKDVMHPADIGYSIEGHGDPEGNYFHRLYPIEALRSMLKECDYVVVTLPLTPETKGMFGETEFRAMKPGAFMIVVSRGGIVDENALIEALIEHRLSGAALDVFSQEPLPSESALWKIPNLIITPHVSGFSPRYKERAGEMFADNLNRYFHGESLMNKYDPDRYY
ncbi:MAG: oxidoreductase [Chloroflexi bacterium]|nr:MAG: oxidoreductase [Chloroflexota bacterium]MBA4375383.1 D-2-hydroxyacid dehydrogenase [Anaerolinea sp.]